MVQLPEPGTMRTRAMASLRRPTAAPANGQGRAFLLRRGCLGSAALRGVAGQGFLSLSGFGGQSSCLSHDSP